MPTLCLSMRKSTHRFTPPPRRSPAFGTACRSCPQPSGTPPACAPPPASPGCDFPAGFPFVYRRQLRVMARRQFGCLDEYCLQMFIALPGNRPALFFAGRIALRTGQPAIAGRLCNRRQPLHLSDFQRPAQRQDLAHPGMLCNRLSRSPRSGCSHSPLQPPLDRGEKLQLSPAQLEQFHY